MGFDLDDAFAAALNRLATPTGAVLILAAVAVRAVEAAARDVVTAALLERLPATSIPEGTVVAALDVVLRRGLEGAPSLPGDAALDPTSAALLWTLAFPATVACYALAIDLAAHGSRSVRERSLGDLARWTPRLAIGWVAIVVCLEAGELWAVTVGELWAPASVHVPVPGAAHPLSLPLPSVVGLALGLAGFLLAAAAIYAPAAIVVDDASVPGALRRSLALVRRQPLATVFLPFATLLLLGIGLLALVFVSLLLLHLAPPVVLPRAAFGLVDVLASAFVSLAVLAAVTRAYCDATDVAADAPGARRASATDDGEDAPGASDESATDGGDWTDGDPATSSDGSASHRRDSGRAGRRP